MPNKVYSFSPPLHGADAEAYVARTLGKNLESLVEFPRYFLIEPINICNARCRMCGIDFDAKTPATLPEPIYDRMIAEIGEHRDWVEKVMLYLDCEPLLARNLATLVRKAKERGIRRVNIATNAGILDERRARELIEAGLDEIYFSLDSLDPATFEYLRQGLRFKAVHDNIMGFISLRNRLNPRLRIRVQMILQKANRSEPESFRRYWGKRLHPDDQVVVVRAHNWASAVKVGPFGDEDRANDIPCISLWGTFCVHVDGKAILCCMDSRGDYVMGDVTEQSIREIWTGDRYRQVRELHLAGKRATLPICDGCTVWREGKHFSD